MLIATAVLSHEHGALVDRTRAAGFRREVERIRVDGASVWTHAIVEKLTDGAAPSVRKEAR